MFVYNKGDKISPFFSKSNKQVHLERFIKKCPWFARAISREYDLHIKSFLFPSLCNKRNLSGNKFSRSYPDLLKKIKSGTLNEFNRKISCIFNFHCHF